MRSPACSRPSAFRSALVTGALSTDAARGSDAPFDPRIHALRRHRGQSDDRGGPARADGGQRHPRLAPRRRPRVQDPYCLRCQPQVMGAGLDLLRQAAATLAIEANGVSDNPLIFADDDEALSGGNFHAEPVAFAADMIALAICEIGSLAERRIAMLVDPALSGLPAFLTPKPGLNSGFMIAQVTAAALVSENKQRAYPASVDFDPDLGQPGGSRLDGGARRAAPGADGRERSRSSGSRRWRRRRAATSTRPCARARRSRRCARGCAAKCRASTTTAISTPTSPRRSRSCARARWSRRPAELYLPSLEAAP